MIDTIYVEEGVRNHPRAQALMQRYKGADVVPCERYGEVFNRKSQSFRLQKKNPALILAEKFEGHVLPTPEGYGVGSVANFYFSHMLNCLYDCRYCFLQGMYRSANYVLFVNYEDFQKSIDQVLNLHAEQEACYFFSGYDCDSLALESLSQFLPSFLPFFRERPRAWLELRTKSIAVGGLLREEPFENCVVAFSMTPHEVAEKVEHGAPSVEKRIEAMVRLAERGWNLGLRFDPLIYHLDYARRYAELFESVFSRVPAERIHSVSMGPLRFPTTMFRRIHSLYPESKLLAGDLVKNGDMVAYSKELEAEMDQKCRELLMNYVPESIFFSCTPQVGA